MGGGGGDGFLGGGGGDGFLGGGGGAGLVGGGGLAVVVAVAHMVLAAEYAMSLPDASRDRRDEDAEAQHLRGAHRSGVRVCQGGG